MESISKIQLLDTYCREADRFVAATRALADCQLTRADYDWLCERNRSRLMMDKAGNKEVSDRFEGNAPALLLMDGKVRNAAGDDGADHANWYQLRRAAHRMQKPIAAIGVTHQKVSSDPNLIAEMLDAAEFRNLSSCFESCVGTRVLLIQNLWVAAGLMNGALGWVQGYVWPKGRSPDSTDSKLAVPFCAVVNSRMWSLD